MEEPHSTKAWWIGGGALIGLAVAIVALGLTGVFTADRVSAMDTDFERVAVGTMPSSGQ